MHHQNTKGELSMKKVFAGFAFLFVMLFVLAACGGDDDSNDNNNESASVISTLEAAGYVMSKRDADSTTYYETNHVNQKFDLSLDVTDLYIGYINEVERWVEVIVMKNESQATTLKNKLVEEAEFGRFVIQEGSVIILTFSQETSELFD